MKKKILSFIMIFAFLCVAAPINITAKDSDDSFIQVSNMVSKYWEEGYIESIDLTINDPFMVVNREQKEVDPGRGTTPILENDRTLLPIRAIVEIIGGMVDYQDGIVSIIDDGTEIVTVVGSNVMTINGQDEILDVPSQLSNDRTMMPVRAVAEALNCDVSWDSDTDTATITRDYQTKRIIVRGKTNISFDDYAPIEILELEDYGYVLQFDTIADAQACCESLNGDPNVEYAEPDVLFLPSLDVAESGIPDDWGYNRTNIIDYVKSMSSSAKTRPVSIAVVDTGIDTSCRLFNNRLKLLPGLDVSDESGHGTKVAGIIATATEGLNVSIIPYKCESDRETGFISPLIVAEGIKSAVRQGADVINVSQNAGDTKYHHIDFAVEQAVKNGVALVASAGNNDSYTSPARVQEAITVGAITENDDLWEYSNRLVDVDIVAPGEKINVCGLNNEITSESGTSFAAPFVAAALGVLKAENPSFEPEELQRELEKHTEPMGDKRFYGAGILNMKADSSVTPEPEIKTPTPKPEPDMPTAKPKPDMPTQAPVVTPVPETVIATEVPKPDTPTAKPQSKVVSYTWSVGAVNVYAGSDEYIKLYANYNDGTKKDVTSSCNLYSNDTNVASVDSSGKITGKHAGKTTVYFDYAVLSGITVPRPLSVTVTEKNIPVTDIFLMPSVVSLSEGETQTLETTVRPSNATNKKVIYTSDNNSVATVSDNGVITARSAGTATIRAASAQDNSVYYNCSVTVYKENIPVTSIVFENKSIELGKEYEIDPIISPPNATDKELIWSSSNPGVATVSQDGVVTPKSIGYTDITARAKYGNAERTRRFTVLGSAKNGFSLSLDSGFYTGAYDEDIPVDIEVITPDDYVPGSHKYTLWIAYLDGYQWQQVKAVYVDGGSALLHYYINAKEIGIPKDKNRLTFAFALFDSNNFTTGASIVDQTVNVTIK